MSKPSLSCVAVNSVDVLRFVVPQEPTVVVPQDFRVIFSQEPLDRFPRDIFYVSIEVFGSLFHRNFAGSLARCSVHSLNIDSEFEVVIYGSGGKSNNQLIATT